MKRRSKALRIKSILCALVLLCISTASFVGCSNGKVEQSSAVSSVSSVSETVSSDESKADTAAVSEAKENTVSDNSSAVSSVSETASSKQNLSQSRVQKYLKLQQKPKILKDSLHLQKNILLTI